MVLRYVEWLERRRRAIAITAMLAVGVAVYLTAFKLPLHADLANLLPNDAPAVRDAEKLAARVPAQDTMLMLVVSPDPATREAAAREAADGLRALPADLVERVDGEDADTRAFVRRNAALYASVADLEHARDTLAEHVADAKLRANPAYISLDPPKPLDTSKLHARADRSAYVSPDGRIEVLVIRTAFRAMDIDRDIRTMTEVDALATRIRARHPLVAVGFAGGPSVTLAEHRAMSRGMLLSSLLTLALVAAVLFVHLRSLRMLALLTANIAVATLLAFGIAALAVGHLNAATAFLGAIIAGNGINYGILLVARYLEERRTADPKPALATAIAGTLRPTLVASLGAAVAYGSLFATQFRGFADFALIGGTGMLVCWACSFTLLPLAILTFARSPRTTRSPFGAIVVRLFAFRRPVIVCAVAGTLTVIAGGITVNYIAHDPYEYDMTRMRARAADTDEPRRWLALSDRTFGRGLAGLGGQTYVAVDDGELPAIVDSLDAASTRDHVVGRVSSIRDVIPPDQSRKLAVIAELRTQIDRAADLADEPQRSELLALRPPDDLHAITTRDLPRALAAQLAERDGRIGAIVAVRPGAHFDETDGRDLIRFAGALRQATSDRHVAIAGASVLFADVLVAIQDDGPLITLIAILGVAAVVTIVVGLSRRSVAVLAATGAGSLAMVAACAIAGLKVNFLDFVALPITLGLGVDYAINVAERPFALRSTGGSVLVCSLTTMIGYASLLVCDNLAIRGFGLASLVGEVTCVVAALVIVPAIIALPSSAPSRLGEATLPACDP